MQSIWIVARLFFLREGNIDSRIAGTKMRRLLHFLVVFEVHFSFNNFIVENYMIKSVKEINYFKTYIGTQSHQNGDTEANPRNVKFILSQKSTLK